jgi:hypothetical protein
MYFIGLLICYIIFILLLCNLCYLLYKVVYVFLRDGSFPLVSGAYVSLYVLY